MAAYEEGYDDERFATPVPENLHCGICLNVLRNPMQCVRNEHFFCNQCITRFLRQAQRCPNCNEHLTLQTLRPSRVIRDFVQELVIKCDNFARGCGDSVKLENLEAHVARCGFSQVQCSNEGCELIVNRKDQAEHEMNECNFRLARCQVCGENVNYSKRKLHCYVSRREMKELVLNNGSSPPAKRKRIIPVTFQDFVVSEKLPAFRDENNTVEHLRALAIEVVDKLNVEFDHRFSEFNSTLWKSYEILMPCNNHFLEPELLVPLFDFIKTIPAVCHKVTEFSLEQLKSECSVFRGVLKEFSETQDK